MSSLAVDTAPLQEIMLEFRAGKMSLQGKRVVPDTRKGLIRIGRGEEGLIHFQWIDRTQNVAELDQIIFPDEALFEKVTQTSERVYILKFTSDDRKFFFWMQEPASNGDQQLCNSVNCYINRPIGEDEAEASVPMQSEASEDTADDDLSSRAGNLGYQNVTGESAEVTSSAGPVQLADLQRILRNIQQPTDAIVDPDAGIGLGDILKPDLVSPLLETLPLEQELSSYLPEGSCNPQTILELLQSAPFRQQIELFSHVLRTGQIDLTQFEIDPAKYNFTVISFLEALDDAVAKKMESREVSQSEGVASDKMDES